MFTTDPAAAAQALEDFLPNAGHEYASTRNYDYGPTMRHNVSMLSPWVRLRMLPEWHVCQRVLAHHSDSQASKFIDEVCWRTYWKGWLELRPVVWHNYRDEQHPAEAIYDADPSYLQLIAGESGIDCMDIWTRELKATGTLHNHARMWYASIWVHTLKLPWALGAGFFLRHLLDGDAASNTLSWRWVAGLHTKGKSYLAQADNIRKYTDGRIDPDIEFAAEPVEPSALTPTPTPPPATLRVLPSLPTEGRIGLLLHDEDLSAVNWLSEKIDCSALAGMLPEQAYASHQISENVTQFRRTCLASVLKGKGTYCPSTGAVLLWAKAAGLSHVVMAQPSVGMWDDVLPSLKKTLQAEGIHLNTVRHWWDERLFPQATAGFFRFKKAIPSALDRLEEI